MRLGLCFILFAVMSLKLSMGGVYSSLEIRVTNDWVPESNDNILRIAHRGASGYAPENTMAAFEQAYKMDADMIELDVQLSSDGQVVVIHDAKLNRTSSGKGPVQNMTLNQLQQLDAGSWYSSKFHAEKIPRLDDVLKRFGGKIPLLIELKSSKSNPGIEQRTAELLQKYSRNQSFEIKKGVIIQSFDIQSLRNFHEILPEVPLAVLTSSSSDLKETYLREHALLAQYLSISRSLATETNVRRIHDAGMKVFVWNTNQLLGIPPILHARVNGIITDYPDIVPTHIYDRF